MFFQKIILVIVAVFFCIQLTAFSSEKETALANSEQILQLSLGEIDIFLKNEVGKDGLVSFQEVNDLEKRIKIFTDLKEHEDEYLKNYNIQTETEINPLFSEIINLYKESRYDYGKKYNNLLKIILSDFAGTDLKIETCFRPLSFSLELIGVIIFLFYTIWFYRRGNTKYELYLVLFAVLGFDFVNELIEIL